jgi:integrase
MPLTDIIIRNTKEKEKQYKLLDEKGLHLLIHPNGSKYWRLRYRFANKENMLALGVYPEISLKEARDKRDEVRKLIREGINPSEHRKQIKLQQITTTQSSFEVISREWHVSQKSGWTEKHAINVLKRLEADIFPLIGLRPIKEIKPIELLAAIKNIEKRGAIDVAKRALQTCGQIFRYAVIHGKTEYDITTGLRDGLSKPEKQKHFASLSEKDLPEFLRKLENYDGDLQTKLALKLLIITFVRTTELRGAKWEEFDLGKKEWHIPAERMKMREPHIVPLSKQALTILEELKSINGHREHLFPNRNKPLTFISENTMLYAIYRMGYHSRTTAHGFRATASTILNEHNFNSDVIELQLSHAQRNKVRASYNFATKLPDRHKMMQWWPDYLEKLRNK